MGMTRRQRSRRLRPRRCLPRSPPGSPRQALVTLAEAPPPGNLLPALSALAFGPLADGPPVLPALAFGLPADGAPVLPALAFGLPADGAPVLPALAFGLPADGAPVLPDGAPAPPADGAPVLPDGAPAPPADGAPVLPDGAPAPPVDGAPVLPAVAFGPPADGAPVLPDGAPAPPADGAPVLPDGAPAPPADGAPGPPVAVPGPLLRVRQNYQVSCEAAINNQINLELYASYVYLSIAFYFDRQSAASKHFATFFLWQSREERAQAQALMRLQNQRRGRLRLRDIRRPDRSQWESGLRAMKSALHVERIVNQSLLSLLHLATDENDVHLCDFLKHHHLRQDVEFINNFGVSIIQLRKLGAPESSLAEYLFDTLSLGASMKN